MLNKGLLVVISGPSGAGKGTLCKALLNKSNNIIYSISCTTRKPRNGEIEGVNYFFKNKEEFKQMISNNEFLEHAEVYDNFYGTPRSFVEKNLNDGKDVILEIDIQGALKVQEKFKEAVFIFIMPPSMEELKSRIVKRGSETEESLNKRFGSAFEEINYISKYNYIVINDEIEEATKRLESIIIAEKCRIDRAIDKLDFFKEGFINE